MGDVNTDHNPSRALIRPLLLEDTVLPHDFVLCSGCGCMVTKKYWDVHLGTHQDFAEVVEVLREVSRRMFGDPVVTATVSEEVALILVRWESG